MATQGYFTLSTCVHVAPQGYVALSTRGSRISLPLDDRAQLFDYLELRATKPYQMDDAIQFAHVLYSSTMRGVQRTYILSRMKY